MTDLFERALVDYVKSATSKLCVVNAKKLRKFMSANPQTYPGLPDDTALGNMLSAFFRFRATIYDVEKVRANPHPLANLRPIWINEKSDVMGLTE